MKCPRRQHENPPQTKFCLECEARVALTCIAGREDETAPWVSTMLEGGSF